MSGGAPEVLASRDNPFLKQLRDLEHARGVKKHGLTLVAGDRNVDEALRRAPELAEAWVSWSKDGVPARLPGGVRRVLVSRERFVELDFFGTRRPLLLVRVPEPGVWDGALEPGATVLVPFQDPENVGAVIRSSCAFGVSRIVLLEEAAHPFHPKSVRASAGTVFGAPMAHGPSLDSLDPESVLALSQDGRALSGIAFPERFALLPGLEGGGLPERLRAGAVAIPMAGDVESLNAAAATAVALFAWRATFGS